MLDNLDRAAAVRAKINLETMYNGLDDNDPDMISFCQEVLIGMIREADPQILRAFLAVVQYAADGVLEEESPDG